ncbi:ankyrin repeat domain-containing protein [uncultured Lacinutrix sp.]|uniref:ankyrin repeat domain-containing protein n=1 Tax=uncultured Lacinutrix sp. TaxID=574032 RepID=UPI00262BC926|nr:ankyrin repeat domain-containing protein [uncultured Lacinutrix sp.]
MITLLIKTALILIIVLGFYKILIEKESFFSTNRMYLILGLVLTFTIPFVSLPKLVQNQGFVSELLEPSISEQLNNEVVEAIDPNTNQNISPIEITAEKQSEMNVVDVKPSRSVLDWILIAYIFGVIVLSINLLAQIGNLIFKVIRSKDKIKDVDSIIINSTNTKEPCSFFNYIFINPEQYEFEIYEQIIAHEKIHVKKRHSIDLLLSEIAVILLWFNPFIWLFRKEVEKNIEYQTDHLLIDTNTTEKDSYQMNLLKIATYNKPLTITTNYNQSLIKQRILKMNSKKSNPHSYWKYAFTFPMFFALLLLLNKPYEAFGQPEQPTIEHTILTDVEKASEPEYFSDCEAFKIALEEKDVAKLKEILINLDPACIEYIENSEYKRLTSVKTKLKEGADLKVDTTGNIVISDANGTTTETLNAIDNSIEDTASNIECRALLQAIGIDDIKKVRALLTSTNVNCIDPNPGYNVDQSSGNYMRYQKPKSPLFSAARYGYLEIAKLLVEKGADVKLNVQGDGTPLITASEYGHLNIVKYLVSKGADINRTFPNQGNALIAASSNGHLNVMKYLISEGADINHYSPNQGNALIAAAHSNNTEAVKFLVNKGMDVNFISPNQGNALIAAANNGQLETVKYLVSKNAQINKISPNQGTPLIAAANNGHLKTLSYLISKGAKIDKVSPNQGTALIAASNNGHLKTVEFLVAKGANVNKTTSNQGSAVNAAANNRHKATMEYLINNGADINNNTNSHGSPLISAAKNSSKESIIYLIEKGADINSQNDGQGSALNTAARNGLIDTVKLLLSKGANINAQTNGQGSALNAAARNGHLETVKLLIEKGADINLQNNGQGSALNAAARNGHNKVIVYLLSKGADINLQNNGQGSALNAAARNGLMDTVKLLVEKGANINLYSNGQGTALSAASRNRHDDIVDYLLSKGAKHIYGN